MADNNDSASAPVVVDAAMITKEYPLATIRVARVINKDASIGVVTTRDGKSIRCFHCVLRLQPTPVGNADGTVIRLTVWKRTELFASFRVGSCVQLRSVAIRTVRGTFVDYHPFGIHMNANSSVHPAADDPSINATPVAPPVQKRARTPSPPRAPAPIARSCPDGCATPATPFCAVTGRPHVRTCPACQSPMDYTASRFCPQTGEAHATE